MIKSLKPVIKIAEKYKIPKPFLVGGYPRDKYLGRDKGFYDFDITTNSSDSLRLGVLFADEQRKSFTIFQEGNVKVFLQNTSVDFSSNFKSDQAYDFISNKGLEITDGLLEAYSRDFTINTLQLDIETGEIIDYLGLAKKDLESKIVRTIMPPRVTIGDDPRRAIRAINFAARYDFEIDESLIEYVSENIDVLFSQESNIKDSFLISKISSSIKSNADKTFFYIDKMGILNKIPLEGLFKEELIKRRLILRYLDEQ